MAALLGLVCGGLGFRIGLVQEGVWTVLGFRGLLGFGVSQVVDDWRECMKTLVARVVMHAESNLGTGNLPCPCHLNGLASSRSLPADDKLQSAGNPGIHAPTAGSRHGTAPCPRLADSDTLPIKQGNHPRAGAQQEKQWHVDAMTGVHAFVPAGWDADRDMGNRGDVARVPGGGGPRDCLFARAKRGGLRPRIPGRGVPSKGPRREG